MVATAVDPNVVNHTVLVLKGGQGVGKSTYLSSLIPKELSSYVYSGILDPQNKDTLINLAECILIQLDELEALTRNKEAELKEIITKSTIRIRRPYSRYSQTMRRHASLCGSVNIGEVLHDPSGSRRFLIHEVTLIDYQKKLDLSQVYAQAYQLYKTGFRFWFDAHEIQQVTECNKSFEVMTVEEELLLDNYEIATNTDPYMIKMKAVEILRNLYGELPHNSHGQSIRLGRALTKHKFQNIKANGVTK